jgi:putative nucleotidyltransferase with HDIG domain
MADAKNENPAVEAFLEANPYLQAMSENCVRVLKLLQDSNFRMQQLVKLIEQDAAIAARVIKTVNSAAYALPKRITQLDRATVYLGFRTVKEIVTAMTVSSICKPMSFGKYATKDLWDHSLGVAVLSRELAIRSKSVDPELAFLSGILHDVGLLLCAQSDIPTTIRLFALAEERKVPFRKLEQQIFGFDHCELGQRLATIWTFPQEVGAAIRWHHSPRLAPSLLRNIAMHVFIADTLCGEAKFGFPLTTAIQKVNNEIFADTGITHDHIIDVTQRFPELMALHVN